MTKEVTCKIDAEEVFDEIDSVLNNTEKLSNVSLGDAWEKLSSVVQQALSKFGADEDLDDLVSDFISQYNRKAMSTRIVRNSKTDKQYIVLVRTATLNGEYEEVCRCELTPEVRNFMTNMRQLAYLDYDFRQGKKWTEEVE